MADVEAERRSRRATRHSMAPPRPRSRQTSSEIFELELPPVSPLTRLGLTENQFKRAMGLSEEAPSPSTVRRALEASVTSPSPGLGRRGSSSATAVSRALDDEAANPVARGDPMSKPSKRVTDAAVALEAKLDMLDQKLDREVRSALDPHLSAWNKVRNNRRRSTGNAADIDQVVSRMNQRRASVA